MAYALKLNPITPEEYLQREKLAETKSEFYDGEMVAMAGGKPNHQRISGNVFTALDNGLREGTCEPFNSDQRVREGQGRAYFYPDITVACEPVFDGDDCLLNPSVIVEVLSSSTEAQDRGRKWLYYGQIPSLRAYVLVSQEVPLVELYERDSEETLWTYRRIQGIESALVIHVLGLTIPLTELYRRVEFTESR